MQNDAPAMSEAVSMRTDLTFSDGFRFGCGFMAAFIIFWLLLLILSGVIAALAFLIAPGFQRLLIPG